MQVLPTIPRRSEVIRTHRGHGGLVAAVLPIHYPRALLRAYNFQPIEVWGPPGIDSTQGAAHLQPYVCSIVRNALSFVMGGGLDVADMILVPHGCDSLQGLASILIDFIQPRQPVLPLYLPRGEGQVGVDFLAAEYQRLSVELEGIAGRRPTAADLLACIQREEEADLVLARLHQARRLLPLRNLEFYQLIRAREYLRAEDFLALGEAHLAGAVTQTRPRISVVLSGVLPEPMQVLQALEEMGVQVAGDDLICCGRRVYPPGRSEDPFRRLAESTLGGPPDSTRGCALEARLSHVRHLVESSGADGVIFCLVKFCEPELFGLPVLRQGLQSAGIPSVVLEADLNDPLSQQTLTRLEAFAEIVARGH